MSFPEECQLHRIARRRSRRTLRNVHKDRHLMGSGFLRVLREMFSEFPNENRNGLRMSELVIDHRRIYRPIHSSNRACRQLIVKSGSFADQGEAVSFFHKHLHLGRMRGTRILRDPNSRIGKQLKKPLMRIRMALWVVQHGKVVLQISSLQCGFTCHSVVPAEAHHEPVATYLFDTQVRMLQRQSPNGGVNNPGQNLFGELSCIAVSRTNRTRWQQLLVHGAEAAKQALVHQRSAAESDGTDLSTLNRNERVDDLIPRLQQQLGQRDEGKAGFGWPDT